MKSQLEQQLEEHLTKRPQLGTGVFVAHGAVLVGDVTIGDHSSIWYNAVLRGDINRIVIGHHSNVQDNSVLHLADAFPCLIGNYVTIGHSAIVHACEVRDGALIGMGATVLDGAIIGEQSLIAARALVPQGMEVPPGSMVVGIPGRVVRQLSAEERAQLPKWAEKYVQVAAWCRLHGSGYHVVDTGQVDPAGLASINCQTQVAATPAA
jgi:carbonic anhydrase/acetyltransferase-like protein (isoleucine patch superfamily)